MIDAAIRFGREICVDLDAALRREWLVTNGLGGYASGTLAGPNTRRYHGLLVAALAPPVERTVLVGGTVEWATVGGARYALSAHEFVGGTIHPDGYRHLQAFALDGMLPVWTFAFGGALLERRAWMAHGANTTYVLYRLAHGDRPVDLEITPLVTHRDFHALRGGGDWRPDAALVPGGVEVRVGQGAVAVRLVASAGEYREGGEWYWNFYHREEAARGLDARGDLYAPGGFHCRLAPGAALTLVATADEGADVDGPAALARAQDRQTRLLARVGEEGGAPVDPFVAQLALAADQFIVTGRAVGAQTAKTVIAGYHWFNDWGRDTMIALPGLTLATGRADDAAEILRAFVPWVADGLLPNNFPDRADIPPMYNTADASLWYVLAVRAYYEATGQISLLRDVIGALREIVDRHIAGTRFGIGVDPADGLLRAGEPGLQLTWMDAKVGDWVVTPRIGKPVEINALWYNALRAHADLLDALGRGPDPRAHRYRQLADRVRTAFRMRFVRRGLQTLADVVDGPDGDDVSVRPNQILAISLPYPLLDEAEAAAVLEVVGGDLLTSHGLRSLSPDHRDYQPAYGGDQVARDGAYHQGYGLGMAARTVRRGLLPRDR